jgi:photosystem II stability/assembly factor-like uncharacterized protein
MHKLHHLLLIPAIFCVILALTGCTKKKSTKPQTQFGSIVVFSNPSGASIYLDGDSTHKVTPDTISEIPIGKHQLKLVMAHWADWEKEIWPTAEGFEVHANLSHWQKLPDSLTFEMSRFKYGHVHAVAVYGQNDFWVFFDTLNYVPPSTGGGPHRSYHSQDAGNSWSGGNFVQIGITDIFAVVFVDANNGWATCNVSYHYGAIPRIIHTTNGGVTWQTQLTCDGGYLYDIYMLNENNGYAVGYCCIGDFWNPDSVGLIYRTTNGGSSWVPHLLNKNLPRYIDLSAIDFGSGSIGYCVGDSGVILKTTDAGNTWNRIYQTETSEDLKGVDFISPDEGWIVDGPYHEVLHTVDGGQTWDVSSLPCDAYHIKFISPTEGWVWGYNGGAYYTRDGGNTWVYEELLLANRLSITSSYTGVAALHRYGIGIVIWKLIY